MEHKKDCNLKAREYARVMVERVRARTDLSHRSSVTAVKTVIEFLHSTEVQTILIHFLGTLSCPTPHSAPPCSSRIRLPRHSIFSSIKLQHSRNVNTERCINQLKKEQVFNTKKIRETESSYG